MIRRNQFTVSQRLKQFALAVLLLVTALLAALYGLIITTNLLTQVNTLSSLNIYLLSTCVYGLVLLIFVWLCLQSKQALTRAFSSIKD